jgi:hypothetical protein
MFQKLLEILDRCDRAFEASELASTTDSARFQTKERYAGNLERAIVRLSSKGQGVWFVELLKRN